LRGSPRNPASFVGREVDSSSPPCLDLTDCGDHPVTFCLSVE